MGKKDNNKKKGKGAAKTEKKNEQKIKKNLKAKGEEDIDTLLSQFAESDKKQQQIVEQLCKQPPSKRSAFTLTPHPEKDQLIMLGGEHFNGTEAMVFSDLFTYTPKQDRWLQIISPGGPPPRCAHQAVAVPQGGGQLWVFGGEFTSKSQSQFYHYKDFWMFSLTTKIWEKITATGGPTARSGHRMVVCKKKLFVFGGFHDNGFNFKYFNDVYTFDLENYKWTKLEPTGKCPEARSACGLAALSDGRVLMYGGFSRSVKAAKDLPKTHTDMFHLVPDKHDTTGLKYKWVTVKQSGEVPSPIRCSFAFTSCNPGQGTGSWGEDKAVMFGGVNDPEDAPGGGDDDDDEVEGQFFDELYLLDMIRGSWTELYVTGKKSPDEEKKSRRKKKVEGDEDAMDDDGSEEESDASDTAEKMKDMTVEEQKTTVTSGGVFTVTQSTSNTGGDVGAASGSQQPQAVGEGLLKRQAAKDVFVPPPRISGLVTVRKSTLYLYGGLYEEADKQLTLNDFYALDLSKLEEWRTIKSLNPKDLEWFESDSESDEDDDDDDKEDASMSGEED